MKDKYRARVLECRLEAGIPTQRKLAELSGIHASIISELESRRIFLSSPNALAISEACDCSLDDLFESKNRD
jgi:transcriptional regulator with XRE-family HTH domain